MAGRTYREIKKDEENAAKRVESRVRGVGFKQIPRVEYILKWGGVVGNKRGNKKK